MIRSRKKTLMWVGVVLSAIFLCNHAWALSLTFVPDAASISVGDSIGLDILLSDLGNDQLFEFNFNVDFNDPDMVLDFDSYTLGDGLGNIGTGDALDTSIGEINPQTINLGEKTNLTNLNFQPNSFVLANIQFTAIAAGTSFLDFSSLILTGVDNVNLVDTPGFELGFGTIQVSDSGGPDPVPEPATILMIGTGVIGMGLFGRKKFRKPIK